MDIAMFDSKMSKQSDAFDSSCERFAAAHNLADVARKTGIAVQMLRNKLNPGQPHQLTVAEMIELYHATGDETLIDGALLCCGLTAVASSQGMPSRSVPPDGSRKRTAIDRWV
jgi:hypothetical protein